MKALKFIIVAASIACAGQASACPLTNASGIQRNANPERDKQVVESALHQEKSPRPPADTTATS
jgi:hypothetical protein